VVNTASARLQAELRQIEPAAKRALDGQAALVAPVAEALKQIEARVALAGQQAEAVLSPLRNGRYAGQEVVRRVTWSLEEWGEFSGDKNGAGALLLACEAEWVQTGRGGDDPDGVLYLTDTHLIFEQKEKKNKTLGLFGGKTVQEVEFAVALSDIREVRAENQGFFGGKDMLFIGLHSGDPAPELKVEVKGGADNKVWKGYLDRAKAGQFIVEVPAAPALPTIDLSAWEGALPAPLIDMGMLGGAMGGFMASAKRAADDQADDDAPKPKAANFLGAAMQQGGKPTTQDDDDSPEKGKGDWDAPKPKGMGGLGAAMQQGGKAAEDDDSGDAPESGKRAD
jgi:hypothetical protein